jgi:hypothetical protein
MSQHNNYKIRECMKTYNIFVFWARLVNQNIAFGELIQNIILLWLIISISKSTIVYLHNWVINNPDSKYDRKKLSGNL